ncbi:MAG: serine/threonine-protein kinase, partial [Candidatus Eisenbacteria bacterium]
MTLTPGTKVGPYEIIGPLGAGGMGEVYRARDTRLGRDVAIKALPAEFARDPERLARFEREAKLLASLSHPNIAGIYGLELEDDHRYLVLEYIEGETLAARLMQGPLGVPETVEVCAGIAAALESAHEGGVVHRDLKSANVMLTSTGVVKVLDFGLAKGGGGVASGSSADGALSASPTMTYGYMGTEAGMVLGTAAYMSPEQARGRALDKRTDIWSFGCVLFECLTGKQAFAGETVSDLIAHILTGEPDWAALPAATPPRLRELLRRCLEKDARRRLRDMGDARIELEEVLSPRGSASSAAVSASVAGAVDAATRAAVAPKKSAG